MKLLITGHRLHKLESYNQEWIKVALFNTLANLAATYKIIGYSGMASGCDLWFCQYCLDLKIPYYACVPFEGQEETMNNESKIHRAALLESAAKIHYVKNSKMVEWADAGIVVWDANKGGTHNVAQQLVESKKPFWWINPVSEKVWECL